MKPSPAFIITLCAVVVLGALTLHTLQGDAAKHDAAAKQAAEGLGGYLTAQEEADKRHEEYMRGLGMSEERITQERVIRSNERLAKAMLEAKR